MIFLIVLTFIIGLGIYYLTNLDFTVGSGFHYKKKKDDMIKDAEYTIVEDKKIEIEGGNSSNRKSIY